MKELNDIDFDKVFKTRITEELPEFEEASWLKMEKKLRKRERLVYYRYASILLVLLSFGMGFYLMSKNNENKVDTIVSKKTTIKRDQNTGNDVKSTTELEPAQQNKSVFNDPSKTPDLKNYSFKSVQSYTTPNKNEKLIPTESIAVHNSSNTTATNKEDLTVIQQPTNQIVQNVIASSTLSATKIDSPITKSKAEIATKGKRKIPLSVAIMAGPDFSSTNAVIGGKTGVSIGATLAVGLTKKLSLQTGLSFGSKNYSSSAYKYTFPNSNINKATFTGIDAACEVLEIPLRASYNIIENQKRSIELNAGLSSYLMIKENYVFRYTKESYRTDRILDVANANQHYLSVVDLSATYNIKLKNKKFAFGIEPYVKIPLTGIGEGSVPLNSSGISLKLRYDFNKN